MPPVRLREEQKLSDPPNEVGLVSYWRQVLFSQILPVAIEHFLQVVDRARHNEHPWIYPDSYNHGNQVVMLIGSSLGG